MLDKNNSNKSSELVRYTVASSCTGATVSGMFEAAVDIAIYESILINEFIFIALGSAIFGLAGYSIKKALTEKD